MSGVYAAPQQHMCARRGDDDQALGIVLFRAQNKPGDDWAQSGLTVLPCGSHATDKIPSHSLRRKGSTYILVSIQ